MQSERTSKFTLILTEDEARLLKAIVQNPLSDDESIDSSALREKIWKALAAVDPR